MYLKSLVVGIPPAVADLPEGQRPAAAAAAAAALHRAVAGRTQALAPRLQPPFRHEPPVTSLVPPPPAQLGLAPSQQRKSPSGVAINWSAPPDALQLAARASSVGKLAAAGRHEVTVAADGRRSGTKRAPAMSRLCRAALLVQLQQLQQLLQEPGASLAGCRTHQQHVPPAAVDGGRADTGPGEGEAASAAESARTAGAAVDQEGQPGQASGAGGGAGDGSAKPSYGWLKRTQLGAGYQSCWSRLLQPPSIFSLFLPKPPGLESFCAPD